MLRLEARPQPSKLMSLLSPVLALVLTALIAALLFIALGKDPARGLGIFFVEPLSSLRQFSEVLLKATPLIVIALGLAVCYRSNVWNIGAEGQFLLGVLTGGGVALWLTTSGIVLPKIIAVPLVLIGLVVAHLLTLHDVGSNNPDGVDIKKLKDPKTGIPLDGVAFHPYYTVHDLIGVGVFLFIFSAIVFFAPEMGGYFLEYNNFIPADALKTPAHIAPVWYFTPYYSMLRAVTDTFVNVFVGIVAIAAVLAVLRGGLSGVWKLVVLVGALVVIALLKTFDAKFWGVVVMGVAVMVLFPLPWLDRSPVRSIRYRPGWNKWLYGIFVVNFFVLGYLGIQAPTDIGTLVSQIGTLFYFGFFLLMPWWSQLGTFKPVPDRVTFAAH